MLSAAPDISSFIGGFDDITFLVPYDNIFQDVDDLLSSVVYDGSQMMTWYNTTLVAIGAADFSNTLAWTSGEQGTNTISYTTVVPEPSSIALAVLGAFGLITRRERQA